MNSGHLFLLNLPVTLCGNVLSPRVGITSEILRLSDDPTNLTLGSEGPRMLPLR